MAEQHLHRHASLPALPTEALPRLANGSAAASPHTRLVAALEHLTARGPAAIRSLDDGRLLEIWESTVQELLDSGSALRRALDPHVGAAMRLSQAGLDAALESVAGGLVGSAARARFAAARARPLAVAPTPVLVVLPANLPGLALQTLLPALARRRPALFKSPSAEPWLTPAFFRSLARREPALGDAYAAAVWPGGESPLESAALGACEPVIAYGGRPALEALARRGRGSLIGFGPRFSVALCHREPSPVELQGLARDIAVGDQRGCLSVHAVLTTCEAGALARALARELALLATSLPQGPADPAEAAAARQLVDDVALRGGDVYGSLDAGVALVDRNGLEPSPGRRVVRVVPAGDTDQALALLEPWRDRLQGAALLPGAPFELATRLLALGVSRTAAPGRLQRPDASWRADGIDLYALL